MQELFIHLLSFDRKFIYFIVIVYDFDAFSLVKLLSRHTVRVFPLSSFLFMIRHDNALWLNTKILVVDIVSCC